MYISSVALPTIEELLGNTPAARIVRSCYGSTLPLLLLSRQQIELQKGIGIKTVNQINKQLAYRGLGFRDFSSSIRMRVEQLFGASSNAPIELLQFVPMSVAGEPMHSFVPIYLVSRIAEIFGPVTVGDVVALTRGDIRDLTCDYGRIEVPGPWLEKQVRLMSNRTYDWGAGRLPRGIFKNSHHPVFALEEAVWKIM